MRVAVDTGLGVDRVRMDATVVRAACGCLAMMKDEG